MKYLHYFEDTTSFENEYDGENYIQPWVSYNKQQEDVDYDIYSRDVLSVPLTFEMLEDGKIDVTGPYAKTIWYTINGGEKQSMAFATNGRMPVSTGDIVQFYANEDREIDSIEYKIRSNNAHNLRGNIASITFKNFVNNWFSFYEDYYGLFKNSGVVDASGLILPRRVKVNCYQSMFEGCASLIAAPALPATTLMSSCYDRMFQDCTSLTTAPVLPATKLVSGCYDRMFSGCTNLNYVKAMFTTTPSTNYTSYWLSGVSPTGTFVKNASATWNLTGSSGIPDGWTIETITV